MQTRTLHLHFRLYLLIFTVLISVLTCINRSSAEDIYAGTQGDKIREAEIKRDNAKDAADTELNVLQDYREIMGKLLGKYDSNNSALLSNRLEQFTWISGVSVTSFIKNAIEKNILLSAQETLSSALDTAIGAVESQIQTLKRKINQYHSKWSDVTVLISAHNRAHSSPSESNHSWHGRKRYEYNDDLPEFPCLGSCGTTMSTPGSAETLHQWTCGPTLLTTGCGEKYYSCPPDYSIPEWHRVFSCTRYNKIISNGVKEFCNATFQYCTNRLHGELTSKGVCSKRLGSGTPGEHSNSDQDISNIIVPEDPPTPPPSTPPPSPTYHACGVHETSVSGDHSLQASCASTDSNGNYCTVTNFYACDSHTHSYPAPPPTPTPPPEPEPTSPPPTTVSCGRSGCTASVSSANEHRVGPCSACSASYWSCGSSAAWSESQHRLRTCRFSTCGKSWRLCQGPKPDCSASSRQGEKCWAQ
ncbi:hypothetical protein C6503_26820 [Candidatus Poribacteria bacterium]|nr:MAG: hypothetical protein C6503_26820 [Candidatus Poribacteria bacterium]